MELQVGNSLSFQEVYCIYDSWCNKKGFYNIDGKRRKPCFHSHAHEKSFLNKNDCKINDSRIKPMEKSEGILKVLYYVMDLLMHGVTGEDEQLYLEFIKTTEDKSYTEVLLFCSSLLIDFHEEKYCSRYISLALKLYLKAYEFIEFSYYHEPNTLLPDLLDYLKYISVHKFEKELFIGYIQVFFKQYEFMRAEEYLRIEMDDICLIMSDICELAHDLQFDFLSLYSTEVWLGKYYTRRSILQNFERYMMLVKYGYEDQYYEGVIVEYIEGMIATDEMNILGFRSIRTEDFNNVLFRSFQVLFLYIRSVHYTETKTLNVGAKVLQIVWATTPEPFLRKEQFLLCFRELNPAVHTELHKAWDWYAKNVFTDSNSENSPRSLRHITKCTVRRRLTACAQLPRGVKELELPLTLKHYLCLKPNYYF